MEVNICTLGAVADIRHSFGHVVGAGERRWWHAETECLRRLRLNQIETVNVKCRCQRTTTANARCGVAFNNGGRPKENGHAEVLFSLVKLRRVFPR